MISKEFTYLKGYARGSKFKNTKIALHIARDLHGGQFRKGGEPYVNHPLRVACHLVSLGFDNDIIVASALLHDVLEDCDITEYTLLNQYGLSQDVLNIIRLLTKDEGYDNEEYYANIRSSKNALIIKICDRCHNISTMANAFTKEKIIKYIQETNDYILPLCIYGKNRYPEFADSIFVMKYHIESLTNTVEGLLKSNEGESINE